MKSCEKIKKSKRWCCTDTKGKTLSRGAIKYSGKTCTYTSNQACLVLK